LSSQKETIFIPIATKATTYELTQSRKPCVV